MPSSLRHPSRWSVFLLLALLALQVGTKTNICLMPDGGVHVIQPHTPCDPAESQPAVDSLAAVDHHLDRQGCLDIAIDEGASASQQKNLKHPVLTITPLGQPITLAETDHRLSRTTQPDIPSQLLPLRSIAVLRI